MSMPPPSGVPPGYGGQMMSGYPMMQHPGGGFPGAAHVMHHPPMNLQPQRVGGPSSCSSELINLVFVVRWLLPGASQGVEWEAEQDQRGDREDA